MGDSTLSLSSIGDITDSPPITHSLLPIPSQGQIIITDDIIGQIFVKTRTRKSLAKNLDLLLTLKV
jgi:hypothetical protein